METETGRENRHGESETGRKNLQRRGQGKACREIQRQGEVETERSLWGDDVHSCFWTRV